MARHVHADLIHAYAEGAEIECLSGKTWVPVNYPAFYTNETYRIKPEEPKWYEKIPPHGVLCWVSDLTEEPDKDSAIAIVMNKSSAFCTHKPSIWRYATPLTDDEIKQFLRGE